MDNDGPIAAEHEDTHHDPPIARRRGTSTMRDELFRAFELVLARYFSRSDLATPIMGSVFATQRNPFDIYRSELFRRMDTALAQTRRGQGPSLAESFRRIAREVRVARSGGAVEQAEQIGQPDEDVWETDEGQYERILTHESIEIPSRWEQGDLTRWRVSGCRPSSVMSSGSSTYATSMDDDDRGVFWLSESQESGSVIGVEESPDSGGSKDDSLIIVQGVTAAPGGESTEMVTALDMAALDIHPSAAIEDDAWKLTKKAGRGNVMIPEDNTPGIFRLQHSMNDVTRSSRGTSNDETRESQVGDAKQSLGEGDDNQPSGSKVQH
ncbi:hypothetical protein QBC47DRAFT_404235 [Echria macrotheca]|uniref:Uncharacterized protein n=1 Tax=Echria macrotheca TaxID=438768 RepID=A0AAJ0F414_9PEZI|nr:hypothetical protein QBC47DRAFT_404235 [Echria macrotheca]